MTAAMDQTELARIIVEDRWRQATTRPVPYGLDIDGWNSGNSKLWLRILRDLEELGVRLVSGHEINNRKEKGSDADGDYALLEDLVWQELGDKIIHDALVEWAVRLEVDRALGKGLVPREPQLTAG